MSPRALTRLLMVAGVLVIFWLGVSLVGRTTGAPTPDSAGEIARLLDGLTGDRVPAVTFKIDDRSLTLDRREDRWTIDGHPADSALVARFWASVEGAVVGELAARNPDNHARMGLASDSTLRVTFRVDGEERTLLVGHAAARLGTSFVRLPDRDAVHVLQADLRTHGRRTLDDWRDKRIVAVDTARVARLTATRAGGGWTVERSDSAWVAEGAPIESATIRAVLDELASLRATGFLAEGDSLAGRPEVGRLTALAPTGDTLAVVIVGAGESEHWVRSGGDPTLYRVPSWRVVRLLPPEITSDSG